MPKSAGTRFFLDMHVEDLCGMLVKVGCLIVPREEQPVPK